MSIRRVHLSMVVRGRTPLPEGEAHHVRDVLRLRVGDEIEAFDDVGRMARGALVEVTPSAVVAELGDVSTAAAGMTLTIAAAVPKANRADWMVEKLAEVGVDVFVPLAATRSVVLPEGKNKLERWQRIATEAAKQSKRAGVMRVTALTDLGRAIEGVGAGSAWCLSTGAGAKGVGELVGVARPAGLTVFVGPEGGWTEEELAAFARANVAAVALTDTVLRVETAAVAAAAVVRCWWRG